MYNKDYAEKWIKYEESGQDLLRKEHIFPYLEEVLNSSGRILDVGCGWGATLDFIYPECEYTGIDPTNEFFDFIKEKYSRQMNLVKGSLPSDLNVKDNYFDIVLCSMVLHCVDDLEKSVETLFNKVKKNGKVVIIDFNDSSEPLLRDLFINLDEDEEKYVKGLYNLSSDIQLYGEIHLYKEDEIEFELLKYSGFKKRILGPFVGYEINFTC
ncbi:class I SAM-dependent methyltransferase [Nanoarchaeota archaeon]